MKKEVSGFSLKAPNKNGAYYVYIWDPNSFNNEHVYKKRMEFKAAGEIGKAKNYSKMSGWKSIGRWGKPETFERLKEHLLSAYGTFNEYETKKSIEEEIELKEKERLIKEKEEYRKIMNEIVAFANEKGIRLESIPETLKEAKKVKKELLKEEA